MTNETLGELLPPEQSELLDSTVNNLTKTQLERALNADSARYLTVEELSSLRSLSLLRVNAGDTPFTWDKHDFNTEPINPNDPSTCFCW